MKTLIEKLKKIGIQLMSVDKIRFYVCKIRFSLLKKNLRFQDVKDAAVLSYAVSHNLSALDENSAFGMEKRMSLVLYPSVALLREKATLASCLLIGPRTEDDIFWAWSLGLRNTKGFDLFSYSPYIDVGDMHHMQYKNESFDLVILGWVLAYSSNPLSALAECFRVCKPGGYVAIGMDSISDDLYDPDHSMDIPGFTNVFRNLNEVEKLVNLKAVFSHQENFKENGHAYSSIIFKK
jgi:SAM-dependent methyltransferase